MIENCAREYLETAPQPKQASIAKKNKKRRYQFMKPPFLI
jgi:hypothetical protein